MMRGDGKHQTFTRYAKRTNNFINISKTLSEKHQQEMVSILNMNSFSDRVQTNKKKQKLVDNEGRLADGFENRAEIIYEYFEERRQIVIRNYLISNSFYFKKGLFVIMFDKIYRIDAIFEYNKSFVFLCTNFHAVKFHKFANCIEISKSIETKLLKLSELDCKRSYEGMFLNGKTQIIADNLDLLPTYEKLLL